MNVSFMRARVRPLLVALVILVAITCSAGCLQTRYVIQAGLGQLDLISRRQPVDGVVGDEHADARTRVLLAESKHIVAFARARGLRTKGNYEDYVELDRSAVVWFMAASQPLAFEAKVWNFPIVGSFPYLGWFDEYEARMIGKRLERDGWDVYIRPVRAFSTGGWFRDPVLSTMMSPEDDAFRYLTNVLIHELTHANFLVTDQATFNESLASFVGDTMAEEYLIWRFGSDSDEVLLYREEQARYRERGLRLAAAYRELETLYDSARSDAEKRQQKAAVLGKLEREFGLGYRLNNAALVGFRTYNAGQDQFADLMRSCEGAWPRFFAAIRTLEDSAADAFPEPQTEDIDPIIAALAAKPCPQPRTEPEPIAVPTTISRPIA